MTIQECYETLGGKLFRSIRKAGKPKTGPEIYHKIFGRHQLWRIMQGDGAGQPERSLPGSPYVKRRMFESGLGKSICIGRTPHRPAEA